jgi:hypothetical protein
MSSKRSKRFKRFKLDEMSSKRTVTLVVILLLVLLYISIPLLKPRRISLIPEGLRIVNDKVALAR